MRPPCTCDPAGWCSCRPAITIDEVTELCAKAGMGDPRPELESVEEPTRTLMAMELAWVAQWAIDCPVDAMLVREQVKLAREMP